MTLNTFVFFSSDSTATESNVMEVLERSEDITIHVTGSGSISLSVVGKSDIQDGDWAPISVISLKNFTSSQSITESGLYSVPLRGITRIKMVNSGATGVKAYGRIMA